MHNSTQSASLTEATEYLIARGQVGIVWIDESLIIRECWGALIDFVKVGVPIGLAFLPLYGLEDEIKRLRERTLAELELKNVAMIDPNGEGPRLNCQVNWVEASQRYLLIVERLTLQAEFEAELENQSRRRALAEAKALEQAKELAAANAELSRANRELSEFAAIISHDLKSPMRALRYYAEDIETALAADDIVDARDHIDALKNQTKRMAQMLTDLLAYARIGRVEEAVMAIDTRQLVEAIVVSLPRPSEFRIEIIGRWPVLKTVVPALDLVLRNLIDNALKHHDRRDGHVTIAAAPMENGATFTISDDGPGIPLRYHGVVFQPFCKLGEAAAEEAEISANPGSGMGLSLVRKTVETVGATIELESAPAAGRGSCFRLTWPGEQAS